MGCVGTDGIQGTTRAMEHGVEITREGKYLKEEAYLLVILYLNVMLHQAKSI